jgi:hydrogenase/urease accessory protein HupE
MRSLLLAYLVLALPTRLIGHSTGLSTADLKLTTNGLEAELTLAAADLISALAHRETSHPLDANRDGQINQDEFTGSLEQFKNLATGALVVEFDGRPVGPSAPKLSLDEKDNFHIQLNFPGERPTRLLLRATLFSHLPPSHLEFVSVHDVAGELLGNRMLNAKENSFALTLPGGGSTGSPAEPRINSFAGFLLMGVKHIWTGYDHLMFLFALLLVCDSFKSAIQVVTCFTVAHSITLALATLNLVWVASRVVEPSIAASIVYVGVENFIRSDGFKGRWLITFLFGLVHGLGFASVLREMGVDSHTTGVALPLVSFNLGVEAGQVVIAGLLLPLIWRVRKWELFLKRGVPVCSAVVAAIGSYWLVERLWFN